MAHLGQDSSVAAALREEAGPLLHLGRPHRALVSLLAEVVHELLERLAGFRGPVARLTVYST